jgi:hypothetical protein
VARHHRRVPDSPRVPSACPVCGYLTLRGGPFDVCRVCFWEDDGGRDPHARSVPNGMTLAEGRSNFAAFGACDRRMLHLVRPPLPAEAPSASGS